MNLDIIIITYNSSKWLNNCVKSIVNSDYSLDDIALIFVDNNSTDDTLTQLSNIKINVENKFKNFQIIKNTSNKGFGYANNLAVIKSDTKSQYTFFLNVDTELLSNTLSELEAAIHTWKDENVAAFECRQLPYEHPKYYDPLTLDTPWASAAALMVNTEAFEKIGMFDKNIFMYAEDVDLSWNFLLHNYKIKYIPQAVINHYSYSEINEIKPLQFSESISNNLYLRFKYGTIKDIIKGWVQFIKIINSPNTPHKSKLIYSSARKLRPGIMQMIKNRIKRKSSLRNAHQNHHISFHYWDYSIRRLGDFYESKALNISPLISIIVRTCGRIPLLREALTSIQNQTYKNYEILVVEDGKAISQEFLQKEFPDLPIKYFCSNEQVGRSKNGNVGLRNAKGDFLTFLDDDDLYFADHLETIVREIERKKNEKVFYSLAFETKIIRDPATLVYKVKETSIIHNQVFNRLLLTLKNYFPIQTVVFHKSVYNEYGGFDETIDFCEDWDLWLRYSLKFDFNYIEKVTSIYRVPYNNSERQKELDSTLEYLKIKHQSYQFKNLTVDSLQHDIKDYLQTIYLSELPVSQKVLIRKIIKKVLRFK
jgi:GT2 family glycosyltransferase